SERRALQEQLATLQTKLQKDQEAIDKLTNVAPAIPAPDPAIAPPTAAANPAAVPSAESQAAPRPAAESSPPPATAVEAVPQAMSVLPANPLTSPIEPAGESITPIVPGAAGTANAALTAQKAPTKELLEATEKARVKEEAAQAAEEAARSITERIELLRANVKIGRQLRDTTRQKVDNADQTVRILEGQLEAKISGGAPPFEIADLKQRLAEASGRLRQFRAESRERVDYLDAQQSELAALQGEQITSLRLAEARRQEADQAQAFVEQLQNPLSPQNMLAWGTDHAPRLALILLATIACLWFSRRLEGRIVKFVASRGHRGSAEDSENRVRTLVGVVHNAASLTVITAGVLLISDELGVPVGPLMGGAAVVGLAIAFGAQSLIKDFFTGFMILMEQQYMVNDVVKIGGISGQVERITLRTTVLRDLEGCVHFIPHGTITSTSNLTHGWSRALFEIGVAYKENVDQVMDLLLDIGRELRRDREFGPLILDDPVMLGVDSFGDWSVNIKFYIKTRPLRQWPVKREMLRRIKRAFDRAGIEIPFPHRTLFLHSGHAGDGIHSPENMGLAPPGFRDSEAA
ncbi:MAG TPA: mechanosensitive ion channel domain-containing protein, partial [Pirellulaceae bacterium]|nr:mechanosensitive ion channel domain-containing protein [Pirellulaceae bacterium]